MPIHLPPINRREVLARSLTASAGLAVTSLLPGVGFAEESTPTRNPANWLLWSDPWGLIDTDDLFAVAKPRRNVKAMVFGHTHHWGVERIDDIHLINLPALGIRPANVWQKSGDNSPHIKL